jgi:ketosteroid isomerase-like protein
VEIVRRAYEVNNSLGTTGPGEPQEFTDLGHAVVVLTKVAATGRGSDVSTEMDETDVFWFRDGQIVRIQGFATKEQALEAAGSE